MKRIIEKRSNEGCVSPPECPTHLILLSVCLSILCLFCISSCPQLGPVRFRITRNKRKLTPIREWEKNLALTEAQNLDIILVPLSHILQSLTTFQHLHGYYPVPTHHYFSNYYNSFLTDCTWSASKLTPHFSTKY
jgi:hypothetical protein